MKDTTEAKMRGVRKAVIEALDYYSRIASTELSGSDSNPVPFRHEILMLFSARTDLIAAKRKLDGILDEG